MGTRQFIVYININIARRITTSVVTIDVYSGVKIVDNALAARATSRSTPGELTVLSQTS